MILSLYESLTLAARRALIHPLMLCALLLLLFTAGVNLSSFCQTPLPNPDLLTFLADNDCQENCGCDLNDDDQVDAADLLVFLNTFGEDYE